jgi:hypothetical protein
MPNLPELQEQTFRLPFAVIGQKQPVRRGQRPKASACAYLQVLDGHVFYINLRSPTATQEGPALPPSGWLQDLQPLHLGPISLSLPEFDPTETCGGLGRPGILSSPSGGAIRPEPASPRNY